MGENGEGVCMEAKALKQRKNEAEKVWVFGVESDQSSEGKYTSKDGKVSNFVLAASIKEGGKGLQMVTKETQEGKFPGGKVRTFGLKEEGVYLVKDNLSADDNKAVEDAAKAIVEGTITDAK
ncbi:BMP family ABC transporter substrate-binding protein [Streptococcus pluranimalium]